jgi:signal transduction histidine kinase
MDTNLTGRLESLPTLSKLPHTETRWLADHGKYKVVQPGLIYAKGTKIEELWIILTGHLSVHIDRGAGPRVVNTELTAGVVSGLLPYSRLQVLPGGLYADERTEIILVSGRDFPEMIHKCPAFTAHTVHTMIDRARLYNSSAMHDEKLISIGRLAAGLAHELNNPASVAIRDARHLKAFQERADSAALELGRSGLTEQQFGAIENLRSKCMGAAENVCLSPIERSDLENSLAGWLDQNRIDTAFADQLADLAVFPDELEKLKKNLPEKVLQTALQWIIAGGTIRKLTDEIERATNRIHKLVEAVKKFTFMDNLAARELVDVETGICDSLRVLDSKSKSKQAGITLEIDKDLPRVYANGAELNQVWFSLLDNALDAIPESGRIHVKVNRQSDLVAVRITDNGPGIPADRIDRIFDPFYTTKPPGQGTGLGLDLSRRLVRGYNGDIYVRSEPGKTEFCVNLNIGKARAGK